MSERRLCLIPARGGSKRLPRKNILDLAGKPVLAYTVEAALASGLFEQVVVSTEDEEVAAAARRHGAAVPFKRPAHLATDRARVVEVCRHVLDSFEQRGLSFEILCVLLPTSPLRTAQDIRGTYQRLVESGADYALAVTTYLYPPWQALVERDGRLEAFWGEEMVNRKSQEVPELLVDSGAVYFCRVEAFRLDPTTFYGRNTVGYLIPPERAIDVDTEFQLRLVRALLAERAAAGD